MNFELLNKLPEDILKLIYQNISPNTRVVLNKSLFKQHYSNYINNILNKHNNKLHIDHYVKYLLRNYNNFILDNLIHIYFKKFISIKI